MFVCFVGDQVEHAHDNPLDVITLGEGDVTGDTGEVPSEKPVVPKKMNLELDEESDGKCEGDSDAQAEGRKTKKKDVKKDKAKRKTSALCLWAEASLEMPVNVQLTAFVRGGRVREKGEGNWCGEEGEEKEEEQRLCGCAENKQDDQTRAQK